MSFENPIRVYDQHNNFWLFLYKSIGSNCGDSAIKVYEGHHAPVQGYANFSSEDFYVHAKKIELAKFPSEELLFDFKKRVEISAQVKTHPNILGVRGLIADREGNTVYVYYRNMAFGSLRSMLRKYFPKGMPKSCMVVCLKEALKGLSQIHSNGQVHNEISADQILVDVNSDIKLAFSATVHDYGGDPRDDTGNNNNYGPKHDIWLIGITALELAYGSCNVRSRVQFKDELETFKRSNKKKFLAPIICPPFDKKGVFSNKFQKMVLRCLEEDPDIRPSADELLRSKIFTKEKRGAKYVREYLRSIEESSRDVPLTQ